MNGPITRNLDEPMEIDPYRPPAPIEAKADNGASVSSKVEIDNSVNKHLPYLWFNGVLGALALGISIGAMIVTMVIHARSTVSENHWRNIEVDVQVLQSEVKRLKDDESKPRR